MQINEYINALPDSYQKTPDSNNYKLLLMEQKGVQAFRKDIEDVQATLDIYTATGKTLDLYGAIYSQPRGSMTDEQYRYIVMQKALRCITGTDTNSIINALSVVFQVDKSEFGIDETENPCEVVITDLPYSILQNVGMTGNQMHEIISAMMPSGVKLAPLELSGTFEFSAVADEQSDTAGFADIEQTIGGYFGYLSTDDIDLPI